MSSDQEISGAAPSSGTLRSLQTGRGLAALMVVLFHLNNSVWGIPKYFPDSFSPLLSFGNAGVQFFFVLSGFIIYLIHSKDVGEPRRLRSFVNKRFIRVYPTYWIVLNIFIITLYLEPFLGTADERRLDNFIASVLLMPLRIEPVLSVAWTLKHEIMFYAVFALAIFNKRVGLGLFALWQVGCLANTLFGSSAFPYGVIFSANNLLFSLGMLAAYLYKSERCPAPARTALLGVAAFIVTGLHAVYATDPLSTNACVLAYGVASATAILGACSYERSHRLRVPKLFDVIGDASYSIYLIHLPLLSVLAKILFASGLARLLPQSVSLIGMLCAVTIAGILFSRMVEMPLIRLLGWLGSASRGSSSPASSGLASSRLASSSFGKIRIRRSDSPPGRELIAARVQYPGDRRRVRAGDRV